MASSIDLSSNCNNATSSVHVLSFKALCVIAMLTACATLIRLNIRRSLTLIENSMNHSMKLRPDREDRNSSCHSPTFQNPQTLRVQSASPTTDSPLSPVEATKISLASQCVEHDKVVWHLFFFTAKAARSQQQGSARISLSNLNKPTVHGSSLAYVVSDCWLC